MPIAMTRLAHCTMIAAVGALAGCADERPDRIEFKAPSEAIYGREVVPLRAKVVNKGGDPLSAHTVAISVVPTEVAIADGTGVRCQQTGDATISLAGGGLSTNATLRCRIVSEISAPSSLRLVLGTDPERLRAVALDDRGRKVEDVTITVKVVDEGVARFERSTVVAHAVGRTVVNLTAGDASSEVPVEVVEKVLSDSLVVSDGSSQTRTFDRGNYLVEINVSSEGSGYGVSAKWVGEHCAGHSEAQHLEMECRVNNTESLVVDNPSSFGMGPAASGNITIYRVP